VADDGRARFDSPQGLAFHGDEIYVADAGNHAVRAAHLGTGLVRTVAGTGVRVRTRADQQAGAMASPWDLAVAGDTLHVAMAGSHQLWALDTRTGRARPHAGGRGEDIQDGPLLDALLAQPMGIAADADRVWFVDAESSAVRSASLDAAGEVRTITGTGLFDFGDRDGEGDAVQMQHQQAIALHADGRLLVADSYNDALKWVDPATRRAETWLRGLHEPGGLALGDGVVYVADTNAHRVVVVREDTGAMDELEIVLPA
jgi:outer membrane protein assembly factor BamB